MNEMKLGGGSERLVTLSWMILWVGRGRGRGRGKGGDEWEGDWGREVSRREKR